MKRFVEQLRAVRSPPTAAGDRTVTAGDCGLLLLRITVGLLLIGHGSQKLFGFYGGEGLNRTASSFEHLGYRPGTFFAVVASATEIAGGLGLALGLLIPLAAGAIIGVMINAMVTVNAPNGLWVAKGGLEYAICITVVVLAIAAIGPGRLALDHFFRWGNGGWWESAVALGLGGISSAIVLSL